MRLNKLPGAGNLSNQVYVSFRTLPLFALYQHLKLMAMQTILQHTLPRAMYVMLFLLVFIAGCKKTGDTSLVQEIEGKKKPPPPPPAPSFYFSNCSFPTINGSFRVGQPASVTVTLNYVNSPGGSYEAFTSATVNGITLTAP